MASKQDEFFFQNLIAAAESSCKAAEYLVECLKIMIMAILRVCWKKCTLLSRLATLKNMRCLLL